MGEMTKTSIKYCRKCKYAYKHNQTEIMCGYYLQTIYEELAGLLKEVKEDYQWANPDYPDCEDCGEWLNWLQLEAE